MIRSGTTAFCIIFLLLMTVGELNNFLFPSPRYAEYVTETSCSDTQTPAQKELYNKQYEAYCAAKKGPDFKRFFVRCGASFLFIFIGISFPIRALTAAFIAAGTLGLCYGFIEHSSGLPTSLRFLFLVLTIGLLCFFLYRLDRKKE